MRGNQYSGTPGIIIPCYESCKRSWMTFGDERLARFWGISGDSEETVLTQSRYLSPEDQ